MSDKKQEPVGSEKDTKGMLAAMPASLAALVSRADGSDRLPPVEKWNPDFCGDLDMRIASDGSWHYFGSPIGRPALVRLFASVLRKDADGKTYLVTPVEKIGIRVDDAPFQAVEMAQDGELAAGGSLTFRTNLGDLAKVDAEHPLRFALEAQSGGLKAYILVRGRLEARLTRALMYDLVALAEEGRGDHEGQFGVMSGGLFFAICTMDELERLGVPDA